MIAGRAGARARMLSPRRREDLEARYLKGAGLTRQFKNKDVRIDAYLE